MIKESCSLFKERYIWIFFIIYPALFIYFIGEPIIYSNQHISPLHYITSIDLSLYIHTSHDLFNCPDKIIQHYISYYTSSTYDSNDFYAAPIFPVLIKIFNYQENNTIPLALFYLFLAIFLMMLWYKWYKNNGIKLLGLIIFSFFPWFFYYSLMISTDLLYFFCVSLVFFSLDKNKGDFNVRLFLLLCVSCTLIRPAGVLIAIFALYQLYVRQILFDSQYRIYIILFSLFTIFSVFYFLPYFTAFMHGSSKQIMFGDPVIKNLHMPIQFSDLPSFIYDLFKIVFYKILYFFGLTKSESHSLARFIIRFLFGLLSLYGTIVLIYKGTSLHRQFFLFNFVPLIFGFAIPRYIIFLLPLCLYYALSNFKDHFNFICSIKTYANIVRSESLK